MPGLVGIFTKKSRESAELELRRMVASMQHESWYVSGTWIDEALGLYLGWVERSEQCTRNTHTQEENGDLILAFSGEEFSACEESGDVERQSYLLRLAEEDPSFPKSLNGRFHGVVIDKKSGTATLFNDRYGMHRVYFHETGEAFYFAAEAKAILAVQPKLRSVDPQGLAEFVSCGCVLENRTIFKGIRILPPASAWIIRNSVVEKKGSYFDPQEWEGQTSLQPTSYYEQLRGVFSGNMPRYFGGPERIGVSLTGGLDSRMIMAWHKAVPNSLPCYSFGGMYSESQDVAVARRVAKMCGQKHEVITVGEDFLGQFPRYAERTVFLTDGCVEVKHAPDLYVNERAAKIAPVRMTGNYGGEVLRSVRAFKPVDPVQGLFDPSFSSHLKRAKEKYRSLVQVHPLSFAVFCQAPWHHYGLLSLEQSQLTLRSPYLDNEFVRTVFRAPQETLKNDEISLRLIGDGDPALRRLRTDRGIGGDLPYWAAALQRAYLEFTFKAEYAYDYGMPQAAVRVDHALSSFHLERMFLGRHKFYHYRAWYRDVLGNFVREILLDRRAISRPYLQRNAVESMIKDHLGGRRNCTTAIHKILTLEYIHRLFIDAL
jgi:asparagine synthase (glutamine-hydrolysing)